MLAVGQAHWTREINSQPCGPPLAQQSHLWPGKVSHCKGIAQQLNTFEKE